MEQPPGSTSVKVRMQDWAVEELELSSSDPTGSSRAGGLFRVALN